ncbi:hypothetical protein RUM43_004236 [Polyplax serrata]|uniref:A-kinase anchor protein 7-like phosphoesterase domain-containing protein n=1 Tax=Polyplax serrata TaxID=468196 RepID=A0AAN8SBE7_POLSC
MSCEVKVGEEKDKTTVTETDIEQEGQKNMKIPRVKPNFFLAFKVNDIDIHKKVKHLQEQVLAKNSALYPAIINISTLHITLAVTHLKNEEEIDRVRKMLDNWAHDNLTSLFGKPLILTFAGVNTFGSNVAYVDIEKDENYKRVCSLGENLNDLLVAGGFTRDNKPVNPHLTILKLSRDRNLLRSKKNFKKDFELIKENNDNFGKQEVSHIQLLSMDDPKCEKGYYKCYHQIDVTETKDELDHSECCAPICNPDKSS